MSQDKSPQEISKAFDELIQRSEGVQTAARLLDRFREQNPEPVPPETFQNAEELADYLQRKEEYGRGLAFQLQQSKNHKDRYKEAAEKVRQLLPDNSPLIHEYQGDRYVITHVPGGRSVASGGTGGTPEIRVEKQGQPTEEA